MNVDPAESNPKPASSHRIATLVVACTEITLGSAALYWESTVGVRDQTSPGELFFFWGSLAALFGLVLPGLLLLPRSKSFWGCQLVPALLLVYVVFVLLASDK